MRSNRLTSFILGYCLVLLLGAAVFGMAGKATAGAAEKENTEVAEALEIIIDDEIPNANPVLPEATPTPVVLYGATEFWNQLVCELSFNWEEISEKPCVLFKKPEASNDGEVEGFISEQNGNTVKITLENCEYTDFYYSSLERRANGHYFNAQPPVAKTETESAAETTETRDTQLTVADPFDDPLRGLECRTVRETDGSYTITVKLTMDKTYDFELFETECFYVVALGRENQEGSAE